MLANSEYLMDQVFSTDNFKFAKFVFNDLIASDSNALSINLGESTFVDQFTYRLQVGVSPCNVGFTDTQHVDGGLVEFDENAIVDLAQAEQLEYFTYFWCNFVDTEIEKQSLL